MLSVLAINAPVHAPVPGNGIPTKIIRPKYAYFLIVSFFSSAFLSHQETIFLKGVLFKNLKIIFIKNNTNGIGSIFPKNAMKNVGKKSIPRRYPVIIPPLNSITGNNETRNTIVSFDNISPRFSMKKLVIDSTIYSPPFHNKKGIEYPMPYKNVSYLQKLAMKM